MSWVVARFDRIQHKKFRLEEDFFNYTSKRGSDQLKIFPIIDEKPGVYLLKFGTRFNSDSFAPDLQAHTFNSAAVRCLFLQQNDRRENSVDIFLLRQQEQS